MVSKTNENALEEHITNHLKKQSYLKGLPSNFNKTYSVDSKLFWDFLENTQSQELEKLKRAGDDWQLKILERFDRILP